MHSATLRIELDDPAEAQAVAAALSADAEGFATVDAEGAAVVVEAEADEVLGLLRTLDDVVRSASAAEGVE